MARCTAPSLRDRALRFRPSVLLPMIGPQGCDDVDEARSFSQVHLDLAHPTVRICFRYNSLRLVKFSAMHFQKGGVRSKVSAVEASIRMRARPCHNWDNTIAIGQRLREDAASKPLEIGAIAHPIFWDCLARRIDQRAF